MTEQQHEQQSDELQPDSNNFAAQTEKHQDSLITRLNNAFSERKTVLKPVRVNLVHEALLLSPEQREAQGIGVYTIFPDPDIVPTKPTQIVEYPIWVTFPFLEDHNRQKFLKHPD
ncbi:MAG TPA: hypothetical protein VGT05_00425 [Patescibacteria group bacterium]|nr:hypothetical protein [Patescibacteria group bacterium]